MADRSLHASDTSYTSEGQASDRSSSEEECWDGNGSSSEAAAKSSDECSKLNSVDSASSDDEEDPLYLRAKTSTDEAILRVLKVYIPERWTKTGLDSCVKLIRSLLPSPNLFPTSGRSLLARLDDLSAFQVVHDHFYCSKCQEKKIKETYICQNCINCQDCRDKEEFVKKNCDCHKTGIFFEFPVEQQLKYMFECRGLASAMDQYHTYRKSQAGCLCDITDGSEYVNVRSLLTAQYDVVFLANSDGVELSTSSKQELWPILSYPCEILPNRRSYYMLISGVYVDSKKPKMNTFLKPFVDSMRNIHGKGGISWIHPESKNSMTSQVVCPVLCADAPAKAIILYVKNHNHRFGCNVCEQKAVKVRVSPEAEGAAGRNTQSKKKKKKKQKITVRCFVFSLVEAPLRTGGRMFVLGELAERRNKSRKGVIGLSVVSDLPFFDRGLCISAEYLHVVLLGVVKYFLSIMCNVRGPWFIGSHIHIIDQFIKTIKVPDFMKRLPRGLRDLKFLKGSKLRAFLLFYSLPAFKPYLPSQYFQHWMLLVISINILLKDFISEGLNAAEIMLRCFVRDTYNVHNLLHLCTLVRRWGNLWATSAFEFESYNGFRTSHVHGTKHLGKELLNNIKTIQGTKALEMSVENKCFIRSVGEQNIEICGKKFSVEQSIEETVALSLKGIETFDIFDRIKINSVVFTSRHYDQNVKHANSFVQFEDHNEQVMHGEILHLVKDMSSAEQVFALINLFKVKHTAIFFLEESLYQVKHLFPVEESGELIVVPVSCLVTKLAYISVLGPTHMKSISDKHCCGNYCIFPFIIFFKICYEINRLVLYYYKHRKT